MKKNILVLFLCALSLAKAEYADQVHMYQGPFRATDQLRWQNRQEQAWFAAFVFCLQNN